MRYASEWTDRQTDVLIALSHHTTPVGEVITVLFTTVFIKVEILNDFIRNERQLDICLSVAEEVLLSIVSAK